ncbi:hypothetical protein ABT120_61005 [Nonomuraea angiospora]|uniref:hypothetical protein n=1 Tax=Nonomuraea angiospora TaxID=46172 RepID=UPI003320808E
MTIKVSSIKRGQCVNHQARQDIATGDGLHTYQELVKAVGQANIILAKYAKVPDAEVKSFTGKWNGLLGR